MSPQTETAGSFWIELLLWILFIVPGVIYSVWRLTSVHKACPKCGGKNLVPPDTPVGTKLLGDRAAQAQSLSSRPSKDVGSMLRAVVGSWTFWLIVAILVLFAIALLCRTYSK